VGERERERKRNDRHTLGCVRERQRERVRVRERERERETTGIHWGALGATGREGERERVCVCVKGQAYFGERWGLLGLLLIFS